MSYNYDYIILGSGPAGRTVAENLARAKKSVCIVERASFGGAELNTRDLPYRLNLDFARNLYDFSTSPALSHSTCHFNLPTLISSNHSVISAAKERHATILAALDIKYYTGFANFLDSHTIAIDNKKLTAKYFIIATGAELKTNEISGLATTDYLTPDNVFKIPRLPKFVFVVGGGATGIQIAEYFAMLGSGVIIMERAATLLPHEDEEVGIFLKDYFENELGITVVTNAKVVSLSNDYTSNIVIFTSGATEKMVRVNSVVLATGSKPSLDFGLENAGINYQNTGITVDKYFTTTTKNIFAIGDCIDTKNSSSARSILEAHCLSHNLLHRQKTPVSYAGLIRSIYSYPGIATVGLNENDAISRDIKYKKSLIRLEDVPGILSDSDRHGFIKLLSDSSRRHLIGATVVSNQAESIISELALAISRRLDLNSIIATPHSPNTPAAAIPLAVKSLLTK